MKKMFFEAIRAGGKRTTVRLWRRQMVRAGEVHTVPGLGKGRIEAVGEVALSALTESDAAADGFASKAELTAALRRMYPALGAGADDSDGRKLYLVRFAFPPG